MDENPIHSKGRSHSFTTSCGTQEYDVPEPFWSSNYNLKNAKGRDLCKNTNQNSVKGNAEFYNRFDHDVVPVKESRINSDSGTVSLDAGIGDSGKVSMTNSDLAKHEDRIYKDSSSLEYQNEEDSSVKFFKNTVQQIFDNFYKNMRDFKMYQKKFHDILEKHQDETVMESFIKDLVQHILTSEHSATYSQKSTSTYNVLNLNNSTETGLSCSYFPESKNENEVNCIPECKGSKEANCFPACKSEIKANCSNNLINPKNTNSGSANDHRKFRDMNDDILNIYFVNGTSHVEIKMNNRQLLSEINIKDDSSNDLVNQTASAENINRLAAKKKELEQYFNEEVDNQEGDKNIPVKTTHAKKNIHFEGDSLDAENKSFMFKICGYLCKMFRKIN